MSGHNKWSSIKHKKAAADAKRGKIFTKIIREITVAAKEGGGDIESNPNLRLCVSKAKAANMPQDNITRAIKKGTGELEGVSYEEQQYEGYGPNGVAIIVRALTDNKNRTAADIRAIFNKRGGSMAAQGAVSYMFKRKGFFVIPDEQISEDDLFMIVSDAGAEDLKRENEYFEVVTELEDFDRVRVAMEDKKINYEKAELTYIPDNTVQVTELEAAKKLQTLLEYLEDNDDAQSVHDNAEIDESILSQLE